MPKELPTFEGWTIDLHLQELRKMHDGEEPMCIPFASQQGQVILLKFLSFADLCFDIADEYQGDFDVDDWQEF